MGEPPHVPVGLDDLGPQDVVLLVLPHGHSLQAAVELKGLRAQLQHWREEEEKRGGRTFLKENKADLRSVRGLLTTLAFHSVITSVLGFFNLINYASEVNDSSGATV